MRYVHCYGDVCVSVCVCFCVCVCVCVCRKGRELVSYVAYVHTECHCQRLQQCFTGKVRGGQGGHESVGEGI